MQGGRSSIPASISASVSAETHKGFRASKAIVSVNDSPVTRQAFKGLTTRRLAIKYSVGAAGRGRGETGELLIRSW